MRIREPHYYDKLGIDKIYNEFFSSNEYPDFLNKDVFPCSFVITSHEDDKVILAGGVKPIAEVIVVTDQSLPKRVRFDALFQALGSAIVIATEMKHKQLHVFVNNDEKYVRILQRFGFKILDAKLLVLDFEESHGQTKDTYNTDS